MNKEEILLASKLYKNVDELSNQIIKIEKEQKETFLITIHSSININIDNVSKLDILNILKEERARINLELSKLGCEA